MPRIPLIVAGVLATLLLLPGMPKWPLLIIIAGAAFAWWQARKKSAIEATLASEEDVAPSPSSAPPAIEVRLGTLLGATYNGQSGELLDRVAGLRRQMEQQFGFAIPSVRISEAASLGDQEYEIRLLGSRFAAASLFPGRILAIGERSLDPGMEGIATIDPSFGVPALWIEPQHGEKARASGFKLIDPMTVIVTHLSEVIHGELAMLLSRSSVVRMLDEVRERQPGLVEELVPNILSVSDVQRVFQNLVAEGVSIGNPDIIVEHLVDVARFQKDPAELTELVRQRTSYAICNHLRGIHDDLAVLNLDPRLENQIVSNLPQGQPSGALLVEPRTAESLLRKLNLMVDAMHRDGRAPVLLCSAELRRHFKAFTRRSMPRLAVLSVNEIPNRISLTSFDVVRIDALRPK